MIKLNGNIITPTIFPDKTSQVWKVPEEYFHSSINVITWEFENEAEFMHVAQLKDLIYDVVGYGEVILELPYLPYARQDKVVSNNTTFALHTFSELLNSLEFTKVKVFDPHNPSVSSDFIANLEIQRVDKLICYYLLELKAKVVYPDEGAQNRYWSNVNQLKKFSGDMDKSSLYFIKNRDSLTGNILGLELMGTVESTTYLIVDDLCDGGRTFIEVAKKLYELGAKEVHLYVSHGIFSKGLQVLRDVGIKRIFTHKGEVK